MRFTKKEMFEILKKADGTAGDNVNFYLPDAKAATPVKSATTNAKLFATALTAVKGARTPTNFELRLMQTTGTIPDPGRVRNPNSHDDKSYSVTLSMKAWIPDLGDWARKTLTDLREGDAIVGKIPYTKGGEKKDYDFTKDFNYKVWEINKEQVDSKVVGQTEIKEVALLQNLNNPKETPMRVEKKAEPPPVDPTIAEWDKVIGAQDKEWKKIKDAAAAAAAAALKK